MNKSRIIKTGQSVLNIEANAINKLSKNLDNEFYKAVASIVNLKGKLIISGVGKSGNIAAKLAASFTSTGVPAIFLNPVDASHGDMGIVSKEDILIALSNSGESHELSDLLDFSKKKQIKIISITSNKNSLLSKNSDITLLLPTHKEADKLNTIPTTSTTLCLSLGDALCCSVLDIRNFDKKSFKELHPGGKIGKKLKTLNEIMDKDIPIIDNKASIKEAVLIMTEKKYGCAVMIDRNKKIKGILTDGDLRRAINQINLNDNVKLIIKSKPITAKKNYLISSAVALMNKNAITSLIVAEKNVPIGIVNLKQCIDNE
ncbi:MAG: KpsF/GutQ family sugar-phosphate isomerase [alpha proteobacterium HIMB59]|nr:MAG: KpsF/GutQ family sugar-phosphate isomerase [alpha proteobacterium HIMB59]|tara:strand:+ start:434 stop:1381 length:948 start_codon:yes stop_codon:yes gene_type:complete